AWMSGLAAHGIWGLASPQSDTGLLMGGSLAVGANLALTVGAISSATGKRLPGRAFGVVEMLLTTPSIAVGSYELATPGRPSQPPCAGLTAWPGALFVHGVASLAVGIKAERERIERSVRDIQRRSSRGPRLAFMPTRLAGGPVAAQAFVVSGVW